MKIINENRNNIEDQYKVRLEKKEKELENLNNSYISKNVILKNIPLIIYHISAHASDIHSNRQGFDNTTQSLNPSICHRIANYKLYPKLL